MLRTSRGFMSCHALLLAVSAAGLLPMLGCCHTAEMRLYLAAADISDPTPKLKFYRVTVRGNSQFVKSYLQTGFYDAEALHLLFGEVPKTAAKKRWEAEAAAAPGTPAAPAPGASPAGGQPKEQPFKPKGVAGKYTLRYDPATERWEVLDDDQRFTIIWSANADAVSAQIQAVADSKETGQQMGSLLAAAVGAGEYEKAGAAEEHAAAARKRALALATSLKATADKVDPAKTTLAQLRAMLLAAAQGAAQAAGSKATFDKDPEKGFKQAQAVYDVLSK